MPWSTTCSSCFAVRGAKDRSHLFAAEVQADTRRKACCRSLGVLPLPPRESQRLLDPLSQLEGFPVYGRGRGCATRQYLLEMN